MPCREAVKHRKLHELNFKQLYSLLQGTQLQHLAAFCRAYAHHLVIIHRHNVRKGGLRESIALHRCLMLLCCYQAAEKGTGPRRLENFDHLAVRRDLWQTPKWCIDRHSLSTNFQYIRNQCQTKTVGRKGRCSPMCGGKEVPKRYLHNPIKSWGAA